MNKERQEIGGKTVKLELREVVEKNSREGLNVCQNWGKAGLQCPQFRKAETECVHGSCKRYMRLTCAILWGGSCCEMGKSLVVTGGS